MATEKPLSIPKFSAFFAISYFFSLNGMGALANLSVIFLLKEQLHLNASQSAYFQAVTWIAWVVKPLWGYLSDRFPIGGRRRQPYLIFASVVAGFSWIALSQMQPFTVPWMLLWISIGYIAYAFQDVATDGLMVEVGQPAKLTGRFQSIQWSAVYLAIIITSFAGGAISDLTRQGKLSYQFLFLISGFFPLITLLAAVFFIKEKPAQETAKKVSLKKAFENKTIWLAGLFLFLWMFSPSVGPAFMYYSVDTLKFSGSFLGALQGVAGMTAFLTSLFLSKWIDRLPVRKCLVGAVFLGIGLILLHLIYFAPWFIADLERVRWITLIMRVPLAFFDTVILLLLFNLAARLCPQETGGTSFALLMSFYNLGQMGGGILGGLLLNFVGLPALIVTSAVFSLFALLVLPHLPIAEPLTPVERLLSRKRASS